MGAHRQDQIAIPTLKYIFKNYIRGVGKGWYINYIRGVGKGGGGKEGSRPPTFCEGGASPPLFFATDDNFLSSANPLHTSVYRTNGNIKLFAAQPF